MLGTIVEVYVDRPLNSRDARSGKPYTANWGFITDEKGKEDPEKEVCVLGVSQSVDKFQGKIVASVNGLHKKEIYIVAPAGTVVYAPEIREALGNVSGVSLHCLYEKSCGAVVFRGNRNKRQFLLIKNLYGKHWGFPKGHMEFGETERTTATREVLEETGLPVRILDGFREISGYHPRPRISKRVIFFLAEADSSEVVIQQEEIERFRWASYESAMELFRFDNDKRVLTRAWEWLKKNPHI